MKMQIDWLYCQDVGMKTTLINVDRNFVKPCWYNLNITLIIWRYEINVDSSGTQLSLIDVEQMFARSRWYDVDISLSTLKQRYVPVGNQAKEISLVYSKKTA